MTDPTIQDMARATAIDAIANNCNLSEVPFHAEIADAVAKATLEYVRAALLKAEGYGTESAIAFDQFIEHDLAPLLAQFDPLVVTQDTDPGSGVK